MGIVSRKTEPVNKGERMKYIYCRCKKELELSNYGGYSITELKGLCPECWEDYIEITIRHSQELERFWHKT